MTMKPKRSRYIIRSRKNDRVILGTWFVPEYVTERKTRQRQFGMRDIMVESCLVVAGPRVFKDSVENVCNFFMKIAKTQGCEITWKTTRTRARIRCLVIGVPTITWIYGLQAVAKKGYVLEKVESFGRLLG